MKFINQAKIYIKGGDGGRGCVSFRREKHIPMGGPNGGDGGKGGHIIFKATSNINTLLDMKYQQHHRAEKGQHGMGSEMHGKNGKDMLILVPTGTVFKDAETDEILYDLTEDGQEYLAAKGGIGGQGNTRFKTATRQAPKFAQTGEPGEEKNLLLD